MVLTSLSNFPSPSPSPSPSATGAVEPGRAQEVGFTCLVRAGLHEVHARCKGVDSRESSNQKSTTKGLVIC